MTFKQKFDTFTKEEQKEIIQIAKNLHKNDSFWNAQPFCDSVIGGGITIFENSKFHKQFGSRESGLHFEE